MKFLLVIDMQNDFITGSLKNSMAEKIVPAVLNKVKTFSGNIIFTRDTHEVDYLSTQEGKKLPIIHCVKGTPGWEICDALQPFANCVVDKPSFGSLKLIDVIKQQAKEDVDEFEICGLCTDICVINNAMIIKAAFPEAIVSVDSSCCAGVTAESHAIALQAMKAVQIEVK